MFCPECFYPLFFFVFIYLYQYLQLYFLSTFSIGRAASSQCGHCPSITIDSNFNGLPPTTQGVSNGDPRMQMFNLPMGSLNANGSKIFSWKLLSDESAWKKCHKVPFGKYPKYAFLQGGVPLSKTSPQWLKSLFYGHRFFVCDTRLWIMKFRRGGPADTLMGQSWSWLSSSFLRNV